MTVANDEGVRDADAVVVPSSDGLVIVIIPEPVLRMTTAGDMDEANAAVWLAYRMRRSDISVRTLQRWRTNKTGPVYYKPPGGKNVWYRKGALDEWIELSCDVDPLAA